jgi:hypothetical protein
MTIRRSFLSVARTLAICGITALPLVSVPAQTSAPTLQNSRQEEPASSSIVVDFGPKTSNAEGKVAANKLLEAFGGSAKVDSVISLHQRLSMLRQGQRIAIEQTIVYPDEQAQTINLPQGKELRVVTPSAAFTVVGSQVRDLSPTQRASSDTALKHDFLSVLRHINDPKYVFSATGKEKLGASEATVVDVNADGVSTQWWIAPDGKLLQERFSDTGEKGPTTLTMKYSDWKSFAGLEYPTKYVVNGDTDQPVWTMTLLSMQVNAPVDPKLFQKP